MSAKVYTWNFSYHALMRRQVAWKVEKPDQKLVLNFFERDMDMLSRKFFNGPRGQNSDDEFRVWGPQLTQAASQRQFYATSWFCQEKKRTKRREVKYKSLRTASRIRGIEFRICTQSSHSRECVIKHYGREEGTWKARILHGRYGWVLNDPRALIR